MIGYSKYVCASGKTNPNENYHSPSEPFESITGIPKRKVIKTSTESLKKYFSSKVDANYMLDTASVDLWQGNYEKAARKINQIDLSLCDWGVSDFASAIYLDFGYLCYFPLNTKKDGTFAVTGFEISSDDYLRGIWYMFNFFRERKERHKSMKKSLPYPEPLMDRTEFESSLRDFQKQRLEARDIDCARTQKMRENVYRAGEYMTNNFLLLPELARNYQQSLKYGSGITCPFQRCRFYLHEIGKENKAALDGIIDGELCELYSSPAFKENSLSNWWVHLCLPSEVNLLEKAESKDKNYFENAAKNIGKGFFGVNADLSNEHEKIRGMTPVEWKDYCNKNLPFSF